MQVFEIFVAVIALGILIFVHELGHFLIAKYCGVGVLEFAIGFGTRIWKKRIGETTYSIRAIPLGGFVRMVGDDPRALLGETAAESEKSEEKEKEPLSPEDLALLRDESKWFLKRNLRQKCAIVIAGPAFNLIFAFMMAVAALAIWGLEVPMDVAVIGEVLPGFPAETAGLQSNDRIVSINGQPISTWSELSKTVETSGGKEMLFEIERPVDGQSRSADGEALKPVEKLKIAITGTAEASDLDVLEGKENRKPFRIGITVASNLLREPVSYSQAFTYGGLRVWTISALTVKGLVAMIQGAISPKHIGGPLMIFAEAAKSAKRGAEYLCNFMIFLSVSLAILNLLPVPVLDGGHLLFFLIEALKGSPLSLRAQERASQFGILLLLLLSVFALYNDVQRYFTGS